MRANLWNFRAYEERALLQKNILKVIEGQGLSLEASGSDPHSNCDFV